MKDIQKVIIAFLTILAIGIFGMIIWVYQSKWTKPLGPALQIPQATFQMPPTWTPDPNATSLLLLTSQPASIIQASQAPDATSTDAIGSCGMPSVTTILAVGSDSRANQYT